MARRRGTSHNFRTNGVEFRRAISKWAPQVDADARTFARLVALKLYQKILMLTPVDTGRARGNWQMDIGRWPAGVVDAGKGKPGTNKRKRRPGLRVGEKKQVASADAKLNGLKLGQSIFIGNNLPYITMLETGTSDQAPNGMVERAMNQISRQFQSAG
jgi:hypothetical protein